MAQTMTGTTNKPAWVDLASSDAAASRDFYSKLFGWHVEVNPDPQYGGYGLAKLGGNDAAGIGPKQDPNAPTAWSLYIGSDDIEGLAKRVTDNGGAVAVAPFDVGDQGRMAVFIDPAGAFISAWQGTRMGGFQTDAPNSFGWAELNARGVDNALPFYTEALRLVGQDEPDGRGPARLQRVPDRRPERRRRLGDEPGRAGRGAELLAGVLRGRRRRRGVPEGARPRRKRGLRSDGLPRRPVCDRDGPAGGELRAAQDFPLTR